MFLDWSLDHYVASLSSVTVFILKSILSEMNIVTPPLFWFPFAWNTFFHLITFSLYVSLSLKLVSCRQHIYGCCFCIHLASLCVLVGTFNHLHLRLLLISMTPLPFTLLFWVHFYKHFLCFLSREDHLAFLEELVWWYWIFSAFACL